MLVAVFLAIKGDEMSSGNLKANLAKAREYTAKAAASTIPANAAYWASLASETAAGAVADSVPEGSEDSQSLEGLSKRALKALSAGNIDSVPGLALQTEGSLMELSGFGPGSLADVKSFLDGLGLSLAD
jgi:DNA-directed RNA polymerase alpha subunit